jgi:hypothetical protein
MRRVPWVTLEEMDAATFRPMRPDVDVGGKASARPLCRSFFDPTWTLGTMSRAPLSPLRILLKICLFIDGIDEFEEGPTQLAELFLSLSSFPNIEFSALNSQPLPRLGYSQTAVAGDLKY